MANYTLTTADDTYTIEDAVTGHRYVVWRHPGHFHAEEFMPWSMDGQGRTTPEDIRDTMVNWLQANGHTVT